MNTILAKCAALVAIVVCSCSPTFAANSKVDDDLTLMLSGYRHATLCVKRGYAFTKKDVAQLARLIQKREQALSASAVRATRDLVATYPMGNSRRECERTKFVLPAMLPAFKP